MDYAQITEIITRQQNRLYRTALVLMKNKADAQDVLQEAFIKLVEKSPRFESEAHETAWLQRVAINLCKNRLRSAWWKQRVLLTEDYPAKDAATGEVVQAVLALPDNYRVVIVLFYYHGYATREIAEITGRKEATVRKDLTRARRLLKDELEGDRNG
ncbi:MAG: sigma-70 family RNA polymerase sigma factor [Defluviitaleaceae bacterium]|nr:sigma-70 family RNA polymerase sigma factor [Defluviitaleaceae bacterium]